MKRQLLGWSIFFKKICNIPSMISSYTVNAQASLGGLLTTFLYSKSAEGLS